VQAGDCVEIGDVDSPLEFAFKHFCSLFIAISGSWR
jgi:hypothetical protein